MDQSDAQLKSGAVITVGVLIFAGLLFYVGDWRRLTQRTQEFEAHLTDVQFIKAGTAVTIGGVRVGRVSDIAAPPHSRKRGLVLLRMEVDRTLTLHDDASLTLKRDGLLGERYLELTLGNEQRPALPAGGEIVFTAVDPTLAELGKQVQEFKPQIQTILDELQKNIKNISDLFEGGELRDIIHEARLTIEKIRADVGEVKEQSVASLSRFEETVADIQRVVRENEPGIRKGVDQATALLEELRRDVAELKAKLSETVDQANTLVLKNQPAITRTIDNLQESSWNMRQFSRKLKANPAVLIFGDEDPTEMEPKIDATADREKGRVPPYPREP
jgi:phospholipid/cholesterol/gamma-HCH transport system substrate-binding protein